MAQRQLEERGYVRIVVLKARQLGASTYIAARGYYKVTRTTGQQAYILAHEVPAATNLFNIVKRMHEYMDVRLKPSTAKSNEKELVFNRLGSGYVVGTAKVGDTGRSSTVQFFHGSEVAYWQDAGGVMSGLLQAIGTVAGTEIWLESTANGIGNFFHTTVSSARKGETDFELAFCPWFWDEGYASDPRFVPKDFVDGLPLEDRQYMVAHGLTAEQMHWRAKKLAELAMTQGGDMDAARVVFAQEYSATIEEAFQSESAGSYIRALPVLLARKAYAAAVLANRGERPVGYGPKKMGIDPSYVGQDKFSVWMRQGRVAWFVDRWSKKKSTWSVPHCFTLFEREQPDEIYMDVGGVGGPMYDMLCLNEKWGPRIVPVLFGDEADEPERYYNKRAEMWGRLKSWLSENPQAMLEDREDIHSDITSVRSVIDTTGSRVKLMSKEDMKKKLKLPSPDDGDALGLTFAYPSIGGSTTGRILDPRRETFFGSGM